MGTLPRRCRGPQPGAWGLALSSRKIGFAHGPRRTSAQLARSRGGAGSRHLEHRHVADRRDPVMARRCGARRDRAPRAIRRRRLRRWSTDGRPASHGDADSDRSTPVRASARHARLAPPGAPCYRGAMAHARAALVDLYVPAHLAELEVIGARAAEAGLDALILACEGADDVPDAATRAEVADRHGVAIHVGRVLALDDASRLLLLGVASAPDDLLATFEGLGAPERVRAAALELGRDVRDGSFAALRVGLRALPDGAVSTSPAPLGAADRAGVVVILAGASLLARDLDCEALGEAGVPLLAATGPWASLDHLGHHATALPIDPRDPVALACALRDGRGFPVEIIGRRGPAPEAARPADPFDGRPEEAESGSGGRRKRPRRRRRGGGGGAAPPAES
jgi:hypothetical protein